MVLIAHHLEVNAILLGISALRQRGRIVHIVECILHLAALCRAGSNQGLSLSRVDHAQHDGRRRHGDVGLLNGKLSRLGAHVVALTSSGHSGRTSIHVVGINQGVVGILNQYRLAVLHNNLRLLLRSVVHKLRRIQRQVEQYRLVGHDAELSRYAALEVALTSDGSRVVAHVRGLVASHLVAVVRHNQRACTYAGHLSHLLQLVVHQVSLHQSGSRQCGRNNGHIDGLSLHVVVVLVAHHLIRYGIVLGIGALRQSRSKVLAVKCILHLAALHSAGSNQCLSLSRVDQT